MSRPDGAVAERRLTLEVFALPHASSRRPPGGPSEVPPSVRGSFEGAPRLADLVVVPVVDSARDDIVSAFDGRYAPLDPAALSGPVERLVRAADLRGVSVVLAISEASVPAAYAFASRAGLPLVVATDVRADLPQAIRLEVDHGEESRCRWVYPLSPEDRIIIVEHRILTGRSAVSCVAALRAQGIECREVAAVLALDDPALLARLASARLTLHAAAAMPREVLDLLHRDRPPD